MLNDEKICELIKEHISEGETDGFYFYGLITAVIAKKVPISSLSSLANKYYLFNVTDKKIHVFVIDMKGNPKGYSNIYLDNVKKIKISNWLFKLGKKISIELNDRSVIKLRANYYTMGIIKQKENLMHLESLLAEAGKLNK